MEPDKQAESPSSLARLLAEPVGDSSIVRLWWLGQAGFAVRFGEVLTLIDPYLSDCLAKKYAGTPKPHDRMMTAPIKAEELESVSAVFCTHRHSDHMDPESLPTIAGRNPAAVFIIPKAEQEHARSLGLPEERLRPVTAGDVISLSSGISARAVPAAHESLEVDEVGQHRFLGYVVSFGGVVLYHSGDCVPYSGLEETIRACAVDLALLPVNGRDEDRRALGVPGNFTVREAFELCSKAGIRRLVPHHFGMFALNTIDVSQIEEIANEHQDIDTIIPSIGRPILYSAAEMH